MTVGEAIKRIKVFALHHAIQELPNSARTVEAFEMAVDALKIVSKIVQCGECEHWDKWACDKDGGHECLYNGGVWMKDEFCSDGKRKEKEECSD